MQIDTDMSALTIPETAFLWLRVNLMEILGGFAVLLIGLFLASVIQRMVSRGLNNTERFDATVAQFLSNVVKYALWIVVLVTVLAQFGVETTSILAALSGVALAIGLALQGTLSNVAAGVMILVQKPFKVGEAINCGQITAKVVQIGLFTTELKQYDGLFVMVPNSELWNKPIINFDRHPVRRFELLVGISYNDDMADARRELLLLAASNDRVLADPEPQAFVSALNESSVSIGLRAWCKTEDYLALSWDLTEKAKARFDDVGLTMPFPQRVVTQAAV